MEDVSFWRLLLAVMAGNFLTVFFLFCFYQVTRAEKEGRSEHPMLYVGILVPLFMAGMAFYLQK